MKIYLATWTKRPDSFGTIFIGDTFGDIRTAIMDYSQDCIECIIDDVELAAADAISSLRNRLGPRSADYICRISGDKSHGFALLVRLGIVGTTEESYIMGLLTGIAQGNFTTPCAPRIPVPIYCSFAPQS